VPRQRGTAAAGQQAEPVVEPVGELSRDMVRNLAAASSIASGIPSSARQMRTIVARVWSSPPEMLAHRARPVPQ
jgi:hypothetical protein